MTRNKTFHFPIRRCLHCGIDTSKNGNFVNRIPSFGDDGFIGYICHRCDSHDDGCDNEITNNEKSTTS